VTEVAELSAADPTARSSRTSSTTSSWYRPRRA